MAETIFIVGNVDLDNLLHLTKNYKNYKIICLSYASHKFLLKNKINHEIGEFYLSESDKSMIDEKTLHTTTNWYDDDKIKNYLTFEGLNLGSLIELEMLHYFLSLYRNAATILKIIEIEKPVTIITGTYLNNFVKKICQEKSIKSIELLEKEQPSLYSDKINIKFNLQKFPISFHISRKNFNAIKFFLKKLLKPFNFNPDPKYQTESILLVDFNPTMYDELLQELSRLDKNILLLNQRRPAIWNLQSLKIILNSKCKLVDLDIFQKSLGVKIKKLKIFNENLTYLWTLDEIFEKTFQINSFTLWQSIKESFVKTCTMRFNESTNRLLLLHEFFDKSNISAILEWAETSQEEKELLFVAKKRQIPTFMLQHNLFPYSKMWKNYERFVIGFSYPFTSNKQIIWDELTKLQALSYGIQEKQLLLAGSPKHDKFFQSKPNRSKGIILLATTAPTNFSIEMTPFESYIKFEEFIREVCTVCKKLPDKKLIVKPHPQADYYTKISSLIKEIDSEIQILYDADLIELIGSCDLLITFNNSTIALESIILNKPTISLQFEPWAKEDQIVQMNALLSISDTSMIEQGIKDLLYDEQIKTKYEKNRTIFLEKFANRGSASKMLVNMLTNSEN